MARGISFKEKQVATLLQTTNLVSSSFTFGSGNLVVIYGPPSTVTLSGSSISGATFRGDGTTNFWTATGTGNAGAITQAKNSGPYVASMSIYEITGGGGETVAQYQYAQDASAGTTATATLTGYQAGNSTIAFFAVANSTAAITPRTSWTEVYDATEVTVGNTRYEEQHYLTGEATASATWTGSADWTVSVLEIGAAATTTSGFSVGTLPVGF